MARGKMNYLLDTPTWINSVKEPETLPAAVRRILVNRRDNTFALADVSLLEASFLARRRKVDFGLPFRDWLARALSENLRVLPISFAVAVEEHHLPQGFQGDPADRLIAATAKAHGLTLITPDREIAFQNVVPVVHYRWRPR